MYITRRSLLKALAIGAGGHALQPVRPLTAMSQSDGVAAQLDADLRQHAAFGDKFSGGPGDAATAAWIAGRLRRYGYRVQESEFDAPYFVKRAARLATDSEVADVLPQAPVVVTGTAGLTAPLIAVEGNMNSAVTNPRGKIALVVAPFGRHAALGSAGIGRTVIDVAQSGASAVVLVTSGPSGEAVALNARPEKPFIPVPMAILAPKRATPFIRAAHMGAAATLTVDGEATHRPCKNIVATLERGERWIAVSTPRTGWFGCVAERGTGTAVFLALADWLVRAFPNFSIFLMNSGGHEYYFAGTHRILHLAPPPEKTVVWAHIGATLAARDAVESDGRLVMLDTADPQRSLMATDRARAAAAEAFRGLSGLEKPAAVRPGAGELSTFTDRGYYAAFAVIGVHRWFHTVEDTLERVDATLLEPVLHSHQRAIEILVSKT
ncbi:MAG: hypothetical protein HYU27_03660 [Acidobacteria bacterium]|nr:hypothetical protein [Acidobacteriota bacterium]